MRRVISIAQRKGGVGKTTLAVCIAGELRTRGHDVALLDSDPQGSACRWADPGNLDFPVSELVLGEQSVVTWAKEVQRIKAGVSSSIPPPTIARLALPVLFPIWWWCRVLPRAWTSKQPHARLRSSMRCAPVHMVFRASSWCPTASTAARLKVYN